jgi:hypothetical protein|nr:MAG TPA: hypothetical protein [Caudoviricetes sp.]
MNQFISLMIENRILNITSDNVLNEKDIDVLIGWRRTLLQAINEMKDRLYLYKTELETNYSKDLESRYIRTSDARNHNIAFVDVINLQIRDVRGTKIKRNANFKAKEYIEYLKTFRKLVKESISEELFKSLDQQAKEISDWDRDTE